ncbi:MAG: hypothetical protein R3F14_38525 [Polyangiaceae bacterium]
MSPAAVSRRGTPQGRVSSPVLLTRSGEGGAFTMALSPEARRALFGDDTVTLYFRVFDGTTTSLLFDGAGHQLWRLDDRPTEVRLSVTPGRPVASLPRHANPTVRGTVSGASGPVAGAYVQAYDEQLGDLTPLGSPAVTDAQGAYSITYDPAALPAFKDSPDLVVKAFSSLPPTGELAVSERTCRAPATAVVDLVLTGQRWRGKTLYSATFERLTARVPNPEDLTAEQRVALACSAGVPDTDVDALHFAAKMRLDFADLPQEVAFGLIRAGLPGEADLFFRHPKSAVRAALRAAIDDNLVSQAFDSTLESVLSSQWAAAAAAWALKPRTGEVCGLAEVLDAADITDTATRKTVAQDICNHEGRPQDFWSHPSILDGTQATRLQLALQHWSLARGHKPCWTTSPITSTTTPSSKASPTSPSPNGRPSSLSQALPRRFRAPTQRPTTLACCMPPSRAPSPCSPSATASRPRPPAKARRSRASSIWSPASTSRRTA